MPRSSTPLTSSPATAITWPSADGVALATPGTARSRASRSGVASSPSRLPCTPSWPLMPEHLAQHLELEAVHHGHHDDQRADAQRDADQREAGDDRDEALLAAGAQVAEGDQALDGGEGHGCGSSR